MRSFPRNPFGRRRRRASRRLPARRSFLIAAVVLVGAMALAAGGRSNPQPAALEDRKSTAAELARGLTGRASVIDGDTIEIRGQRIRLHGIDAPEGRQTCEDRAGREYRCGQAAAKALDEWLAQSRPTRCKERDVDRYKRVVAQCWRADGGEVNAWLVRSGHALDWPRYSKGAYAAEQREAQAARAGVWKGRFEEPWEWRRR
jgi:endonuclease YncB( thermonuclease family)